MRVLLDGSILQDKIYLKIALFLNPRRHTTSFQHRSVALLILTRLNVQHFCFCSQPKSVAMSIFNVI